MGDDPGSPSPLSNRQRRWLNMATKIAHKSRERQRHGAVVVKNGNIVSVGHNKMVNHPNILGEFTKNKASLHAEVAALRNVKNPQGCTIFVSRVMKSGEVGLSKPCPECQEYIDSVGVKKVIYTV